MRAWGVHGDDAVDAAGVDLDAPLRTARIVEGYRYTSMPGIKDDLENAGALWSDAPVVCAATG